MADISASELQQALEKDFVERYGPVLTGAEVQELLRYRSYEAFKKAITRKTMPVPLFKINGQRGKFALASDIASYLAQQRCQVDSEEVRHEYKR